MITSAFRIDNVSQNRRKQKQMRNLSSMKKTGNSIRSINRKAGDWVAGSEDDVNGRRIGMIMCEILDSANSGKVNEEIVIPKLSTIFEV